MSSIFRRTFSLMGMKIRIISDFEQIILDDEYFKSEGGFLHSLLSNFNSLSDLPDDEEADMYFEIHSSGSDEIQLRHSGSYYQLTGPIEELELSTEDKRSSVFGNMGLFSKIAVLELEKRGIFSFHSTSFCSPDENRLFLVLGGSGAGKSSVLLKAQTLGLPVFGTELTHFRFKDGSLKLMKGSLWQNCRMGNLVVDFPELLSKYEIDYQPGGDPWHQYRSVDLSGWQSRNSLFSDPEISLLFPRIESQRVDPVISSSSPDRIDYKLYGNLADKVSPPSMLYGRYFIPSIDDDESQYRRMSAASVFKTAANIADCRDILASPADCLNGIL